MENHPFLWRRIRRVRRIQVCMARKGLNSLFNQTSLRQPIYAWPNQLMMAFYVETSWSPYQLFHRTFTINLTASIVSCKSCVAYTTRVGKIVLSFTTSDLNY